LKALQDNDFRGDGWFPFTFDSSRRLKLDSNFLPMIALMDAALKSASHSTK
jgi:hypothetical protein